MPKKITSSARYTLAIASVAAATLIRMLLNPWVGPTFPFFSFYLAVAVTTWFAGFAPGLVATALGFLVTDLFFFPTGALQTDPSGVLIYLSVAVTIVLYGRSLHQAKRRAEISAVEASQRQKNFEQEIARRQQSEKALQAAQHELQHHAAGLEQLVAERTVKLTETIHSLEGFCYTIAHDLRSPIRAMQGYASVLGEECALDKTAKEYTLRISRAALRMDQLVQDLLVYGRLTHEPMGQSPLHLEAVVDQSLAELADEINSRKAVVQVERPLPEALGQPAVLEQVLVNLLRNAMKFVGAGKTPQIRIHGEEFQGSIRLCVEDNGIGIAPQNHEKIFNVFERLHKQDEYPGTGIGLAIVKKGIERMGGRAGVISQPGKGSCFWLELEKVPPFQSACLHLEAV